MWKVYRSASIEFATNISKHRERVMMVKQKLLLFERLFVAAIASFFCCYVNASVVILGTRVIYPENAPDVSITLNNNGEKPAVIESWLDNGKADDAPEKIKVPFLLSPPVFRIDPQKKRNLRLIFTGDALPKERESVFWLNVLEIPPKPENADTANYLQFAVRSRIKVFYRPSTLTEKGAQSASSSLTWKISQDSRGLVLTVTNPTPYFVSFSQIKFDVSTLSNDLQMGGMVAPFSEQQFDFGKSLSGRRPKSVLYKTLNDFGGEQEGEREVHAQQDKSEN